MRLYAITSRKSLPGDEAARRSALLRLAAEWSAGGVEFVQVREKDLALPELTALVHAIVQAAHQAGGAARVLVNGPAEAALAAGADGVHLPGGAAPAAAAAAKQVFARAGRQPLISVSCHSLDEIRQAREADLLLFGPVFEKITPDRALAGRGLAELATACAEADGAPVFALGGVTARNAAACVAGNAAGVAGIRLFLNEEWRALAG